MDNEHLEPLLEAIESSGDAVSTQRALAIVAARGGELDPDILRRLALSLVDYGRFQELIPVQKALLAALERASPADTARHAAVAFDVFCALAAANHADAALAALANAERLDQASGSPWSLRVDRLVEAAGHLDGLGLADRAVAARQRALALATAHDPSGARVADLAAALASE